MVGCHSRARLLNYKKNKTGLTCETADLKQGMEGPASAVRLIRKNTLEPADKGSKCSAMRDDG